MSLSPATCFPCLPLLVCNEPPCSAKGEFFIADQVWVKYSARGEIENMVVVDSKLSINTDYTKAQKLAKKQVGGALTYKAVRPQDVDQVSGVDLLNPIEQGDAVPLKGFYKLYGDGSGACAGVKP